jgi:hypothetical protein
VAAPLSRDIVHSAFLSSERTMLHVAQPLYVSGLAFLLLVAGVEWGIRTSHFRRRGRGFPKN